MYTSRTVSKCASSASRHSAIKLVRTITGPTSNFTARPALAAVFLHQPWSATRSFSTSPALRIKEFFPAPDAPQIVKSAPAWPHPVYTVEQMNAVSVDHREARDLSDRVALFAARLLRIGLDFVSGYRHEKAVTLGEKDPAAAAAKYGMTETKYMIRNVFLESVAGVPGMVAGMLRHLQSMRRMKRDNGWIETLLEESMNERQHLLIFLKLCEPGWFMRLAVLGAQGVFFNAMFFAYLLSPRTVHRFVGYLEEEAVITYTREIADLDAGRLPRWEKMEAPQIAIDYYKMPEGSRSMRDLLLHVRADEAKHREVNHTLGNLNQNDDPNPYTAIYKDSAATPHPTKDISVLKPQGWERKDVM